jgi:hypothetical protein
MTALMILYTKKLYVTHACTWCYKRRRNGWNDITHSGRVAPFIANIEVHTSTQAGTGKKYTL